LIGYLQERLSYTSEADASMSTGSEMNFYQQYLSNDDLVSSPEQVLKVRLQSRRKLDNSSPMN